MASFTLLLTCSGQEHGNFALANGPPSKPRIDAMNTHGYTKSSGQTNLAIWHNATPTPQ